MSAIFDPVSGDAERSKKLLYQDLPPFPSPDRMWLSPLPACRLGQRAYHYGDIRHFREYVLLCAFEEAGFRVKVSGRLQASATKRTPGQTGCMCQYGTSS